MLKLSDIKGNFLSNKYPIDNSCNIVEKTSLILANFTPLIKSFLFNKYNTSFSVLEEYFLNDINNSLLKQKFLLKSGIIFGVINSTPPVSPEPVIPEDFEELLLNLSEK